MVNLSLFVGIGCAIIFFRAAHYERMSPWPWSLASFALSLIVSQLLSSLIFVLLAQVALFAVMWAYNARRPNRN
jgi:hypothetical protein